MRIVRCGAIFGKGRKRRVAWVVQAVLVGVLISATGYNAACAQVGSERYSSIVVDVASGRELEAANADEPRYPASLTKMMTLYLTFEALRDHRVALETQVPVSQHAAAMSPSKLGLVPGARLTVEQAILGLVTQSANDAAAALGELLGGSETEFAETMTKKAHQLGMAHTNFRNASGLPDPEQMSTARDLARLAVHLVTDFPAEYRYFATPSFRYRNRVYGNHDHLLESYPGADGIKTGFITASGFNLVSSAVRGDVRLVGVVLGAARAYERDRHMMALLDKGFIEMGEPVPHPHGETRSQAGAVSAVPLPPPAPPARPTRWAVSLGAFVSEGNARHAVEAARKFTELGQVAVFSTREGKAPWRAELTGLAASEAANACAVLEKHKLTCLLLKPNAG